MTKHRNNCEIPPPCGHLMNRPFQLVFKFILHLMLFLEGGWGGCCFIPFVSFVEVTLKSEDFLYSTNTDAHLWLQKVIIIIMQTGLMYSETSAAGKPCVVEETNMVLLGVNNVKEMMQKTEKKHKHLTDVLRQSCDKKKVSYCCLCAQPL